MVDVFYSINEIMAIENIEIYQYENIQMKSYRVGPMPKRL